MTLLLKSHHNCLAELILIEKCKIAIQVVNNSQASRKVTDLLTYEPVYQHLIPHKAEELDRIKLPLLRIEGQAPQRDEVSSKILGTELNEEMPLA